MSAPGRQDIGDCHFKCSTLVYELLVGGGYINPQPSVYISFFPYKKIIYLTFKCKSWLMAGTLDMINNTHSKVSLCRFSRAAWNEVFFGKVGRLRMEPG